MIMKGTINHQSKNKENIFGRIDNEIDNFIINMCILNTKIIIYKMGQDCNQMKLIEDLRLLYNKMKADDYESEVNPKRNVYNEKWENVGSNYVSYLRNRRNKIISISYQFLYYGYNIY